MRIDQDRTAARVRHEEVGGNGQHWREACQTRGSPRDYRAYEILESIRGRVSTCLMVTLQNRLRLRGLSPHVTIARSRIDSSALSSVFGANIDQGCEALEGDFRDLDDLRRGLTRSR